MLQESAVSDASQKKRRTVNPFILPSQTKQDLVVLVAAATIFVLQVRLMLSVSFAQAFDKMMNVVLASGQGDIVEPLGQSYAPVVPDATTIGIKLVVALALLTFYIIARYYFHPWNIRLRKVFTVRDLWNPTSIREKWIEIKHHSQDPQLSEEIRLLSEKADLEKTPKLEIGHRWDVQTATAFGFPPFAIYIEPRFRILYDSSPETARAILLHELAHIKNGDVRRGWIANSVLQGPLWIAVVMLVDNALRSPFSHGNTLFGIDSYVLAFGTVALLFYFYSRFLRTRELNADCRARMWGAGKALRAILAKAVRAGFERKHHGFSLHPSPTTRMKYLARPELLFESSLLDIFSIGALLGIAISSMFIAEFVIVVIAGEKLPNLPNDWVAIIILSLALLILGCSYCVMATVGATVQRGVIASVVDNVRRTSVWRSLVIALLLSIGFTAGSFIGRLSISYSTYNWRWLLFSTVGLWLVLMYVQFITKRAATGVTSERSLARRMKVVNALGTVMFCGLFLFLMDISFPVTKSSFELSRNVAGVLFGIFILMYFFLWIFTLAIVVTVWRRKITRCATCAAPVKRILGSACAQCGGEVTPWATVEWIGEFDLANEQDVDKPATELRADRASSEETEVHVSDRADQMIRDFKGEEMTAAGVCNVYEGRYSRNECLDALLYLENIDAVVVEPAMKFRDSAAIPEDAIIYFPINTASARLRPGGQRRATVR